MLCPIWLHYDNDYEVPSLLLPLSNYKTKDNLDTQGGNEGGELSQERVGVGWRRGREPTGEF